MMTDTDIVNLYIERRRDLHGLHAQMHRIKAIYSGETIIPLPDMDADATPSVPNLLQTGVDQMAGRVASVTPEVWFSPDKDNRTAKRKAETRRKVVTGWWQTDSVPTKLKYRARNLLAYSMAPVTVGFNPRTGYPTWQVRDPMQTYPNPDTLAGKVTPNDVIFAYKRSLGWLRKNGYGAVDGMMRSRAEPDTMVTLLEYVDCYSTTLLAYVEGDAGWQAHAKALRLEHITHPYEVMTATNPSRISLEQSGQFDGMVGMYYQQAKLMALEVIAVEKGIFPDTYLEGRQGEIPKFVAGPFDGRTGEVNIVSGGTVRSEAPQPGYLTNGTIDRLERNQRITAGIPAEFGGESPTNVRTGRRGDAVISATIDFPVAEAQEVLALALRDENKAAMALARHYSGLTPTTIYVGTGNTKSAVTYEAAKVFDETNDHVVSFPISGADLNGMMIGMGQRVGMGIMSKRSAAQMDPYISDAEAEHDNIIAEGLEQALMSGLQQQAAAGQIPPLVLARVMDLVATDRMELAQAITKATEEAAQEAAQAAAEEQAQAAVGTDPALAALAGEQPSAIPGTNPTQDEFSSLMAQLRMPTMTIQPNRGVREGAV